MTEIDTSAEAVERVAAAHAARARDYDTDVARRDFYAETAALLRALAAERAGALQLVDRMHAQDVRAIKLWQAAHPGEELTWPDQSRLTAWCLGEIANLRAERDAVLARAARMRAAPIARMARECAAAIRARGQESSDAE